MFNKSSMDPKPLKPSKPSPVVVKPPWLVEDPKTIRKNYIYLD